CRRDTADDVGGAPPHRARRGDAMGYRTAVSLRAMDARSSTDAWRWGSPAGAGAPTRPGFAGNVAQRARALSRLVPGACRCAAPVRVGRIVRDDAGRPAVHRPAPALSTPPVRARLRRQRDDVRLSCGAIVTRLVPRRSFKRSPALRVHESEISSVGDGLEAVPTRGRSEDRPLPECTQA